MRKRAKAQQESDLAFTADGEKARALRGVRAHVNRTGNGDRIQAYGWSIAGGTVTGTSSSSSEIGSNTIKGTSVPVPIYCRPLSCDDVGMKIWCAAAVDLSGGEAGFPNAEKNENSSENKDATSQSESKESNNRFDKVLADLESEINQALSEKHRESSNDSQLSTFVWICSVSHSQSKVTIVNIRSNPGEVLDSFLLKTHLLCIASVPGAKNKDMQGFDGIEESGNEIFLHKHVASRRESMKTELKVEGNNDEKTKVSDQIKTTMFINPVSEKLSEYVETPDSKDKELNCGSGLYQPMNTCLPTMWLGGQNGVLYVYSSIAQWSQCIASIKLSDSILQIIHYSGRVFVALANGKLVCFVRSQNTGEWDLSEYFVIDIGLIANNNQQLNDASMTKTPPSTTSLYSIRCIELAKGMIWIGYRNLIFILDSKTLRIVHSFTVQQRRETQVRQITVLGDGVWCSLRLDSTLKLYSAVKPYQHLQDVDIEPYVGKMLSPKGFSFIRITALKGSNSRLWVGTANGVILSLPCGQNESGSNECSSIVTTNESGKLSMATFVPICHISSAQLSFHGHKDAVKFFVCTKNLVLSGGEGYIDFRLSGDEDVTNSLPKTDKSHLIVWEINN